MKTSFKSVEIKEDDIDTFPSIGILKDECKAYPQNELAVLFTCIDTGMVIHNIGTNWKQWKEMGMWDIKCFRKMRPGEEIIIKG